MEVQPDKDQWWDNPPCKGSGAWVWADEPSPTTADKRVSTCASCPVISDCAQDLVNTEGPRPYPYQVRAGLKLWTDDVDRLPDVVSLQHVPEKRSPGRPSTNPYHPRHQGDKMRSIPLEGKFHA